MISLSSVFLVVVALSTARLAVAAPIAEAEPEIELIRRQGLAAVYSSCVEVSVDKRFLMPMFFSDDKLPHYSLTQYAPFSYAYFQIER